MTKCFLGIDIGGTNTKLGIVDPKGRILKHAQIESLTHQRFEEFVERLYSCSIEISENHEISGVGVGAPNYNSVSGRIEEASNLGWGTVPIREILRGKFKKNVEISNDANIAAIGERVYGHGRSCENFAVITLGTGVGSGVFIKGSLFEGREALACEAGHLVVEREGRECGCGGKGHLESYVSVKGIKRSVLEKTGRKLSFTEIVKLYKENDPSIVDIVVNAAKILGVGLAQVQSLFFPEKIIFTGGGSHLGQGFFKEVQDSLNSYAFGPFQGKTKVMCSEVSLSDGAVLGASALISHSDAIERV